MKSSMQDEKEDKPELDGLLQIIMKKNAEDAKKAPVPAKLMWFNEGMEAVMWDEKLNYYVFSANDQVELGSGSSGTVYKAWKIEGEPPFASLNYVPRAIKVIPFKIDATEEEIEEIKKETEKEAAIWKAIAPNSSALIQMEKQVYLVTERISGERLIDEKGSINPKIVNLPLTAKLELISKILEKVKALHDEGWVHGDIKGQNILFNIASNGTISVSLVDFGSAQELKKALKVKPKISSPGTRGSIPDERLAGYFTKGGDIYSVVPVIMSILGAEFPQKDKLSAKEDIDSEPGIVFNITGLEEHMLDQFDNSMSQKTQKAMIGSVLSYLEKMSDFDYHSRPSADQAKLFFDAMKKVCENYKTALLKRSFFSVKSDYQVFLEEAAKVKDFKVDTPKILK